MIGTQVRWYHRRQKARCPDETIRRNWQHSGRKTLLSSMQESGCRPYSLWQKEEALGFWFLSLMCTYRFGSEISYCFTWGDNTVQAVCHADRDEEKMHFLWFLWRGKKPWTPLLLLRVSLETPCSNPKHRNLCVDKINPLPSVLQVMWTCTSG